MSPKTASRIDELAEAIKGWTRRQLAPLIDRLAESDTRVEAVERQVAGLLQRLDSTEAALRAIRHGARDDA